MNTARNALEIYKEFISRRLGVTLGGSNIVMFNKKPKQAHNRTTSEETSVGVYVGPAVGALVLIALMVYAIIHWKRR